jgi:hypothetical protein
VKKNKINMTGDSGMGFCLSTELLSVVVEDAVGYCRLVKDMWHSRCL